MLSSRIRTYKTVKLGIVKCKVCINVLIFYMNTISLLNIDIPYKIETFIYNYFISK